MPKFSTEVWIRQIDDGEPRYQNRLSLPDATNYSKAYEKSHAICKSLSRRGLDEYRFQVEREDGHRWSETAWFRHNGKSWSSRYETERRQPHAASSGSGLT